MTFLCGAWMMIVAIEDGTDSALLAVHRELTALTAKRYPTVKEMDRMDVLFDACREDYADAPAAMYWRAFKMDRDNKPREARELLRQCLSEDGTNGDPALESIQVDARILLASLDLSMGDLESARLRANEAIQRDGHAVDAYRILIDAAFAQGSLDQALPTLSKAVEDFPDDVAILEAYLDLLAQMGRGDALAQACQKRLKDDPLCPVAHYHVGEFGEDRRDPARRDAHLILAAINGSIHSLSTERAQQRLGRLVYNNRELAQRTGALAWDLVNRCEQRAEHDLDLDDDEVAEALASLTAMSREEPLLMLLRSHFEATLELLRGDVERARPRFEQIVRDHPTLVPALCRLALLRESQEPDARPEDGKRLWEEALRRCPRHPLVRERFRLGLEITLHPEGVRVISVKPESPLAGLGIQVGDVLMSLADVSTREGLPHQRLMRVYHFSGGEIQLRRETGDRVTLDSSILLFD